MSPTEEFQKRADAKPDPWTTAWWNQQFQEVLQSNRGLKHAHHLALAELEDLGRAVKLLQEKIRTLESDAVIDRAKIGELQARVDRQAEFLTQLKQKDKTK